MADDDAAAAAAPPAAAAPAAQEETDDSVYAPPPDYVSGEVDDLARLTNLNEDVLLKELHVRYERDIIYTYVSDILIAVNPFKQLGIYDANTAGLYSDSLRREVPPHVYGVADACYNNLFKQKKNQCAVISGESGAGKTESAKFIINHIIKLCSASREGTELEERIIKVSPLLEAFGNAQTVMNDNSSRFGKYTRLLFDHQGQVMGVQLSEYLLEKSRVVEQASGERNFHIFYYLFESGNLASYHLGAPADYGVLGGKPWDDNAAMYKDLVAAMDLVGFTAEHRDALQRILAAIIHIGDINFVGDEKSDLKDDKSRTALGYAANLIKVDSAALEKSLVGMDTVTRGEKIRRFYKTDGAYDCRDALSKALYSGLFGHIVGRINEMLAPELHQAKLAQGRPGRAMAAKPAYEIGVLDIFGFENFENNSFEQICINVAHEQLQYFFNRHTFQLELEEYELEGVDAQRVTFRDNLPLINMFLGKPLGILALLDEECTFPQATDQSLVDKLNGHFKDQREYEWIKKSRGHPAFAIEHFAGRVEYNATNFLEKNRDTLAADVVVLLQASGETIVNDIFNGEVLSTGQIRARTQAAEGPKMHRGKEVGQEGTGNVAHRRSPTLSAQFKNSLAQLIDRMSTCYPHFVRCIKPNTFQQSDNFVPDFVLTQLRYTGVLEATRIRQEGYSWRPVFADFVKRYKILGFPTHKLSQVKETSGACQKILMCAGVENYMIGKTKLFLKYFHLDFLEQKLQDFYTSVVRAQSVVRAHFARKIFLRRLARARMNAAERAAAEAKEAEERKAREAAEAEKRRLEREAAEAAAKEAALLREARELELAKAEAEARRLEAEAKLVEDEASKERSRAEAERAAREKAEREAEEIRVEKERKEAEIQALAQAAEMARIAKDLAEKEANRVTLERRKSRYRRQELAERQAKLAKLKAEEEARAAEEARIAQEKAEAEAKKKEEERRQSEKEAADAKEAEMMERLRKAEEEARLARERAEENARAAEEARKEKAKAEAAAAAAEAERKAEEERLRKEREMEELDAREGNWTRSDFNLASRVAKKAAGTASEDILIDAKSARGWVTKLGAIKKSWKKRWFIFDVEAKSVMYFESEKAKKEKGSIPFEQIHRVFAPVVDDPKLKHLFTIETPSRTYMCCAPSAEALKLWVTVLTVITSRQPSAL